jgi:hypothetical protein
VTELALCALKKSTPARPIENPDSTAAACMESLRRIINLKIMGVNFFVMSHLINACIETGAAAHIHHTVKLQALTLACKISEVYPNACCDFMEALRDTIREQFLNKNAKYVDKISKLYPIPFNLVSQRDPLEAKEYFSWALEDLNASLSLGEVASITSPDYAKRVPIGGDSSDPVLKKITKHQFRKLAMATLDGLGMMQCKEIAEHTVSEILLFIRHGDAQFRCHALDALVSQASLFGTPSISAHVHWSILPLCGDASYAARRVYMNSVLRTTRLMDMKSSMLSADEDDVSLSEFEIETAACVGLKLKKSSADKVLGVTDESIFSLDGMVAQSATLSKEDQQMYNDALCSNFRGNILKTVQGLVRGSHIGTIPEARIEFVLHNLQQYCELGNPDLAATSFVVMSEIANRSEKSLTRVLKYLLLSVSGQQPEGQLGCANALQNLSTTHPEIILPLLTDHISSIHFLNEGDVFALKQVFMCVTKKVSPEAMEMDPEVIKKYLSSDKRNNLLDKLLWIIEDDSQTLESKRAALGVISEATALADTDNTTVIVRRIIDMVSNSKDSAIQEICNKQLSGMFEALPHDDKTFVHIAESMRVGKISLNTKARLKATGLFGLLARTLVKEESIETLARLLSDPEAKIRNTILGSLIRGHSEIFGQATKEAIETMMEEQIPEEAQVFGRRQGGYLKTTHESGEDEDDLTELTVPLENSDPFNMKYLAGNEWRGFCEMYGLSQSQHNSAIAAGDEMYVADLQRSGGGDDGMLASYRDSLSKMENKIKNFSENEASMSRLILELLKCDPSHGECLRKEIETTANATLESLSKSIEAGASETLAFDYMERQLHHFSVYSKITHAAVSLWQEGVWGSTGNEDSMMKKMKQMILHIQTISTNLRNSIFAAMDKLIYLLPASMDVLTLLPITSEEEYNMMQEQIEISDGYMSSQKKRTDLEQRREAVEDRVENESILLSYLTKLEQILLSCILSVCTERSLSMHANYRIFVLEMLPWLRFHLEGAQHRTTRIQLRDGLINLVSAHFDQNTFPEFRATSVQELQSLLVNLRGWAIDDADASPFDGDMHSERADVLHFVVHSSFVFDEGDRKDLVEILLLYWDDVDGFMRRSSISLMLSLCEGHFSGLQSLLTVAEDSEHQVCKMMVEITKRIKDPMYREKESLSKLLQWTFEHLHDEK